MSTPVIEFFFDIGSPYSYLAATQIDAVGKRTKTPVRWRPFLLGGVFKASGNTTPATVQSKARWMLQDLTRWAEHYGVPFKMSSRFPLNTLRTQRALTGVALKHDDAKVGVLAMQLFQAYWVNDQDISDEAVITEVASHCGLDGAALLEMSGSQAVKDRLKSDTDEAVRRGAFGAPTVFIGDQMFWGNDRLLLVEAMLSQ